MLITNYSVEQYTTGRLRVSWAGTLNKLVWLFVNGLFKESARAFDTTERSLDFKAADPAIIEIHEVDESEPVDPVSIPLVRRPTIFWSARSDGQKYPIYRKPTALGTEVILAQIRGEPDALSYEHRTQQDLRQDGGVWNYFRVEAINSRGKETVRTPFPVFVAGLPKQASSVAVAGAANVFTITLGV